MVSCRLRHAGGKAMFKFLHLRGSTANPRGKRSPRGQEKRLGPDRPVRVYSLLLPPTLPDDRK
jgi:hypothetical protein